MPSETPTDVQHLQICNPLNKSQRSVENPPSNSFPYSKISSVSKEDLHHAKVSSVGICHPRNSMNVENLNVMMVGNSLGHPCQPDPFVRAGLHKKEILLLDSPTTTKRPSERPKMPAIISSEGTTIKPSLVRRAKPPAMPRSKLKQKRKLRITAAHSQVVPHTTPIPPYDEQHRKSGELSTVSIYLPFSCV